MQDPVKVQEEVAFHMSLNAKLLTSCSTASSKGREFSPSLSEAPSRNLVWAICYQVPPLGLEDALSPFQQPFQKPQFASRNQKLIRLAGRAFFMREPGVNQQMTQVFKNQQVT
jgi:hypothetical protein